MQKNLLIKLVLILNVVSYTCFLSLCFEFLTYKKLKIKMSQKPN